MNIVNRAFTTATCTLLLGASSTLFAAPAHRSTIQQHSNNSILERAYRELILNPSKKIPPNQYNHQYKRKKRAVAIAKKQLKIRYRWGGTTPKKGFDCSGLIQYSFKKANISLPRTASSQYNKTKRISISQLQSGDLIFFHTRQRRRTRINHVGIYLGNNQFIHAPRRGKTVSITRLNKYWRQKVVGVGRV